MLTLLISFVCAVGSINIMFWLYESVFIFAGGIFLEWLLAFTRGEKPLAERYGRWAVITGATDGIGKGYAFHLAELGLDLVLISRTESKLIEVAQEIRDSFGVEVKYIVVDYSRMVDPYPRIRQELADLDIGILVNNVGIAPELLNDFLNYPEQEYLQMIDVNVISMLKMTYIVLPGMKSVGRGLIITISSASALFPAAYLAVYSATKGFVHNLTLALKHELTNSGVECQLVVPQIVRTNLTRTWDLSMFGGSLIPDGDEYSRWATWTIGKVGYTSGHWFHALQLFIARNIPHSLVLSAIQIMFWRTKERQQGRNIQ